MTTTLTEAAIALNSAWARRHPGGPDLPPMILMSDPERLPDPARVLHRLPRGAAVLLRDYRAEDGWDARLARARALAGACRLAGLRLLVAGDAALALASGADGLHLPERQLGQRCFAPAHRPRPGWLVTAACHGRTALLAAARAGADAALLSPVFTTPSHPEVPALGPLRFAALVRTSPLAVYALGGIDGSAARRLSPSGAAGIAGIGGLAG